MEKFLPLIHGLDYLGLAHTVGGLGFFVLIARKKPTRLFFILSSMALIQNGLWLFFASASMASSFEASKVMELILGTQYGIILLIQLGLLSVVLVLSYFKSMKAALGFSLFLPFFSSASSHASALQKNPIFSCLLDYFHFLSLSFWAGSLIYLFFDLAERPDSALSTTTRFSKLAMACTGALILSGAFLAYSLGVTPLHPFETAYSSMVMRKVVFLSMVIAVAAVNQRVYLKRWDPEKNLFFIKKIRRGILFEWILILIIFGLAGYLTGMEPPILG